MNLEGGGSWGGVVCVWAGGVGNLRKRRKKRKKKREMLHVACPNLDKAPPVSLEV